MERRQDLSNKRQLIEGAFENLGEIEKLDKENSLIINSKSSQTENAEIDESFCIADDESSSDEEETEEEKFECQPSGSAFIVYWSCLFDLLQRCLICSAPAFIKKVLTNGSALCCYLSCENDHQCVWRSQPLVKRHYIGNLRLNASVLFSSNTYRKLSKYFHLPPSRVYVWCDQ